MVSDLIKQLKKLNGQTLEIYAHGKYPVKRYKRKSSYWSKPGRSGGSVRKPRRKPIPVQMVAMWQNDGTFTSGSGRSGAGHDLIKPARFVEAAEKKNRWRDKIKHAVFEYIGGDIYAIEAAGFLMAKNTNRAVNRIDTGRLKQSFRHKVKR